MSATDFFPAIEQAVGIECRAAAGLPGGCVGEVYRVQLANGDSVVAKVDRGGDARLDTEGYMLRYLTEHSRLPVPRVILSSPELLVMEYVEGGSYFDHESEAHAAELLADLHGVRANRFGHERDTLIGGLPQSNRQHDDWRTFFVEERLLDMGKQAVNAGQADHGLLNRVERAGGRLMDMLPEPMHPSLLHGDIWSSNVLADRGRIVAFIDPAIYYGHPEIELAFITLFSTFGRGFFERYNELRPIEAGFFEERRDIYNLFPLLVHVTLFGGGYLSSVERILSKLGA